MAAQCETRRYAAATVQIELPNQPCALAWVGDALVAATYDYVEAEGARVGGLDAGGQRAFERASGMLLSREHVSAFRIAPALAKGAAVRAYLTWLAARVAAAPFGGTALVRCPPPLDIAWVWHVHRLAPRPSAPTAAPRRRP